jgi:hypothetical protein
MVDERDIVKLLRAGVPVPGYDGVTRKEPWMDPLADEIERLRGEAIENGDHHKGTPGD